MQEEDDGVEGLGAVLYISADGEADVWFNLLANTCAGWCVHGLCRGAQLLVFSGLCVGRGSCAPDSGVGLGLLCFSGLSGSGMCTAWLYSSGSRLPLLSSGLFSRLSCNPFNPLRTITEGSNRSFWRSQPLLCLRQAGGDHALAELSMEDSRSDWWSSAMLELRKPECCEGIWRVGDVWSSGELSALKSSKDAASDGACSKSSSVTDCPRSGERREGDILCDIRLCRSTMRR